MTKLILLFTSISVTFICFGQIRLNEMDTHIDFEERGLGIYLTTPNDNRYAVWNGKEYLFFRQNDVENNETFKSATPLRNGVWVEYFDKNKQPCSMEEAYFFRIGEYDIGNPKGKFYIVNRDGSLRQLFYQYPIINDEIFDGVLNIFFDKNRDILFSDLSRFTDDWQKWIYLNRTYYNTDGSLKVYTLTDDDFPNINYSRSILKTYENDVLKKSIYYINGYFIEHRWKGKKEIISIKDVFGTRTKIIKKNGKTIKEKNSKPIPQALNRKTEEMI